MEFVTGDGALAKSGGRVVKNVSGYDIHKLLIGSAGTLAIITRINFRTFPMPSAMRAFVSAFDNSDGALSLRVRIAQSPLRPLTLDILSPSAVVLLASDAAARVEPVATPFDRLASNEWALTATFAGTDSVLARYQRDFTLFAEQCGATNASFYDQEATPRGFPRLCEFIPIALDSSPATTILRLSVLPTRINDILATISRAADSDMLPCAAVARGVGVIYVSLLPRELSEATKSRTTLAIEQILSAVGALGGNAVIPWCPTEWCASLSACEPVRGNLALMRKLRSVFDPHEILSPGRIGGGL